MRLLIFGDLYGRIGRRALEKELPNLREKYEPDFVIANVENATSGRGPIEKHILELEKIGIDLMTSGDHIFDNEDKIKSYMDKEDSKLIRPINFYESDFYKIFGKGYKVLEKDGKKLLVLNLISETFMRYQVYNPFLKITEVLKDFGKEDFDGIIIDFHKEVSSEGQAMGFFLDGKVSFIFGSHTHVQTNDDVILDNGTGVITDVGMVGPFPSVIGAEFNAMKKRFLTGITKGKIEQSLSDSYIVNGVFIEIKDKKCKKIEKINIRGKLNSLTLK